MSLDKAIEHKKEHRRPYRGAKAIDRWCCNHGNCIICKENRLYKNNKRINKMNDKMKIYKEEGWS